MTTRVIPLLVLVLAFSGSFSAAAEATANSDYAAAEKAAKEAEAAVASAKTAAEQAAAEQRRAEQAAAAKRQQATDAKNLAGEPGVRESQQAEANLSTAIKAVTDATNAKAATDKALAAAKAAALPLQQAYDAAEKAAKEAEAAAKATSDAANKLEDEARKVTAEAEAKRKVAGDAAAALTQAQQGEQQSQAQANAAAKTLADAAEINKGADAALTNAKNQVATATTASAAAEKAA